MNAGRELDALVAEKVMGWTEVRPCPDEDMREYGEDLWGRPPGGPLNSQNVSAYSTDIAAAWEVVDNISQRENVEAVSLTITVDGTACRVLLRDKNAPVRVYEDTAPRAICLAALAAVGHPVPSS